MEFGLSKANHRELFWDKQSDVNMKHTYSTRNINLVRWHDSVPKRHPHFLEPKQKYSEANGTMIVIYFKTLKKNKYNEH